VEVLSVLSDTEHSEDFFRHQSADASLTLLEAQLAALKNTPHGNNLFINLPITVLTHLRLSAAHQYENRAAEY
jgi:hypothetical protein